MPYERVENPGRFRRVRHPAPFPKAKKKKPRSAAQKAATAKMRAALSQGIQGNDIHGGRGGKPRVLPWMADRSKKARLARGVKKRPRAALSGVLKKRAAAAKRAWEDANPVYGPETPKEHAARKKALKRALASSAMLGPWKSESTYRRKYGSGKKKRASARAGVYTAKSAGPGYRWAKTRRGTMVHLPAKRAAPKKRRAPAKKKAKRRATNVVFLGPGGQRYTLLTPRSAARRGSRSSGRKGRSSGRKARRGGSVAYSVAGRRRPSAAARRRYAANRRSCKRGAITLGKCSQRKVVGKRCSTAGRRMRKRCKGSGVRRRYSSQSRKTTGGSMARRRGRSHAKKRTGRRKTRRNPSWSPVVSAVVGAGAGAAAGVLSSYGMKQFNIGTPTIRAGVQIGLGLAVGVLIGMKNPAIGASVGTGMATAGTVSLMDAMGLVIPNVNAAASPPKQLKGIDPYGYYDAQGGSGVDAIVYDRNGVGAIVDNAYG